MSGAGPRPVLSAARNVSGEIPASAVDVFRNDRRDGLRRIMEVLVSVAASSDVLTTNKSPKTGRLEQNRFLSVKHVQSDGFVEYISASANRPSLRLKARRSFSSARLFLRPRAAGRRPAYRRHPAGENCKISTQLV